jgi:hypothetical protein
MTAYRLTVAPVLEADRAVAAAQGAPGEVSGAHPDRRSGIVPWRGAAVQRADVGERLNVTASDDCGR